ncbi:hypothetical protein BDM02DRAFT_3094307 [Thelephora ganbajun]|uniref:Uncharacterized protein n=1 Tax=Thelephora ganbajun TaxID=370292 RepID=A0ACB6ZJY8_THEGA|nr:hypothetical protein BDM02DRAFT_3094307 [Thelephora ganbajun]
MADILPLVLQCLFKDLSSLYACALVDRNSNRAASAVLYRNIVLTPPWTTGLRLQKAQKYPRSINILHSATLPHYATYVKTVEIWGHRSSRGTRINLLANSLIAAIPVWRNLVAMSIDPRQAPEGLFVEPLRLLQNSPNLRTLRVDAICTDAISAPVLSEITGLGSLTVIDPNRALLDLLPDWLSRLSDTLRELRLLDNCGSITPGVLQMIQPLAAQLRSFGLGLSYSLEDGHIFEFLSHLPHLQDLQLRYYWQMKQPTTVPRITTLRKFVVNNRHVCFRNHVTYLSKWVRRITSHSRLEHLEFAIDNFEYFRGPYLNYGGLVEHISHKHGRTIRVLRLMHGYIDSATVALLCQKCPNLEDASLGVNICTLVGFTELAVFRQT